MMSDTALKELLKKLGTIKNELLIFAILSCIITDSFAYSLIKQEHLLERCFGIVMGLSTVLMIFGSGAFFAYAMVKLPSSQQELKFSEVGQELVKEHKRSLASGGQQAIAKSN